MRIGIDVQSTTGKPSGLGYYTKNLVKNLKTIDFNNEYILFENKFFQGNLSTPKRIVWEQVLLSIKAKQNKIDLLHVPAFSPPLARNCKLVVTIHDLIGIRFPENNLSLFSRFYWGKYLPQTAKNADLIITDSECSKKDIVDLLNISSEKVKVIYLAAGEEFRRVEDMKKITEVKIKYNIGKCPYVLYVGNIEWRKNLILLIEAWEKTTVPKGCKLVIVGTRTKFSENLFRIIKGKNLEDKVIVTEYIPIDDLVLLYNGASLFVYPSLYEGFGLPVLEAMSCGVPVITSNVSSLPEVVGNAGLLVDPTSIEEINNAMEKVLADEKLRQVLNENSLLQAKKFTWEKTAKETLQVYKMI